MKTILTGLIILAVSFVYGQGEIIYQEDFSGSNTLEKSGWQIVSKPDRSSYTVKDGALQVRITQHPYKDGYVEIEIPVCRKGVIDFDAMIDLEGLNPDGIGLTLDLYNISTFWHDYCRDWRLYFPEPTAKRMDGFNIEPVGHQSIGKVEKHKWIHYRIAFDTDKDRVECYMDDMKDPAYIKGDAAVLGRAEYQGGNLRIGSFGQTATPYHAQIDNIVIRSLDKEQIVSSEKKDLYLLFQGFSFDYYKIDPALRTAGVATNEIRNYDLDCWRATSYPENTFKYNKLPGSDPLGRANAIVLIDAPREPGNILPEFLLKDIIQSVTNGAKLVIFGGLFTLEKGGYKNSILEKFLPVKLENPWQVKESEKAMPISPVAAKYRELDWSAKPCVYYYHDLKLQNDAEVLLKAGDKPLLVSGKLGKGEILVFLGTVCGPPSTDPPVFWKWEHWPELVSLIIMDKLP